MEAIFVLSAIGLPCVVFLIWWITFLFALSILSTT